MASTLAMSRRFGQGFAALCCSYRPTIQQGHLPRSQASLSNAVLHWAGGSLFPANAGARLCPLDYEFLLVQGQCLTSCLHNRNVARRGCAACALLLMCPHNSPWSFAFPRKLRLVNFLAHWASMPPAPPTGRGGIPPPGHPGSRL